LLRRKRSSEGRVPPRRRIRKLRLAVLLLALSLVGLASFTFGLVVALAQEIPKLDPSRQRPEVNSYVYAADGHTVLAVLRGSQSRVLVPQDQMGPWIRHAIVAVEDKRFYEHRGVDVHGIARAIWADVRHKGVVEGGSTITQQYVKNAYVTSQRSIGRKLREAALAWQLEQRRSKDWILTAYLNTIYFGNGAYGIQQAAQTYFQHGARRLTLAESALLAGIPSDPSLFDPVRHPGAARARRQVVLGDLLAQGYISQADYYNASRVPLPRPQDVGLPGTQGPAPYFANYVKELLVSHYGAAHVYGGGLKVQTTIDLRLQKLAREAISQQLTDPNGPVAALVSVDPQSGRVVTMVGGRDYRHNQFNLAVQGRRQPGSSFKPFVLATALEQGIAPQTSFVSQPIDIYSQGRFWSVHNYEDQYLGTIDLTSATIHSDNTVYAQLTKLVGPRHVAATARRLGIRSPLQNYLSIGLGSQGVNPLEMARAFSVFANGGFRLDGTAFGNEPRAIEWVRDVHGKVVDQNDARPRRVLKPETAALVTSLLQGVVREGTGRAAQLADGRAAAGKTGTTENYGDAWFCGYVPQLVTCVWVGYADSVKPMETEYRGGPVAGGTYPALIWKSFMDKALANVAPTDFPPPSATYGIPHRVVWRDGSVQLDNGYCHDTQEVVYMADAPTRTADCLPNEVEVPLVVGKTLAAAKERLAAQPLGFTLVYKPAAATQRVDVVVGQYPAPNSRLSAGDRVTLVLRKPLHGVVPRVLGRSLAAARARLARAHLQPVVRFGDGPSGRVVSQAPAAGVAAAPRLTVRLVVGRG
jgi:penicillin-binding protein 1A